MALPVSPNSISLSQVNVELGRSATASINMNESAVRSLFGVASGAISMSQGYGKANQFAFSFNGGTNVDLRTAAINAGWNQSSKVIATNTGTVSANSTGAYALVINGSFPNGVEFVNNGNVIGAGGNGGNGSGGTSLGPPIGGSNGSGGGPALVAYVGAQVRNNGTIAGGGGGGGGGQGQYNIFTDKGSFFYYHIGAGGGGGGRSSAAVNSSGGSGGGTVGYQGGSSGGGAGTFSGQGGGGAGAVVYTGSLYGGSGGGGGGWGSGGGSGGGGAGAQSSGGPYGGGSGGAAVNGNGNITWLATGTRLGAIS
jgi:hypothetical protein